MKNKHLYAIILLAALALLQVRVAFAGCIADAQAHLHTKVACCEPHAPPAQPDQPTVADSPCAELCAQPYAASGADQLARLHTQFVPFPPAPPSVSCLDAPPDTNARLSLTAAHPPHTRLIYVLQRLLI